MSSLTYMCLLIVAVTCGTTVRADQRQYSVCDVLGDLEKLHGQIITVKGRLTFGLGVWLRGESCAKHFKVGECEFDDLIAVEWPDSLIVEYELKGKTLFPLDREGARLVETASLADRSRKEFSTTLEGLIVTRLPLTRLVYRKSPSTPLGYGHLGIAPAMIVVKKVIDLKVLEKPADQKDP